jgi:hypothetical protein
LLGGGYAGWTLCFAPGPLSDATHAMLVNQSWTAAARRTRGITQKTCNYLWAEIEAIEAKLVRGG